MNIFVVNCGSSSLKYQLINSSTEEVIAKGICDRITIDGILKHKPSGGEEIVKHVIVPDHKVAVQMVLEALVNESYGVLSSLDEIDAIGHRVVHGGEKFEASVVITEEVMAAIKECSDLAPLHNPANLIGIHACKSIMPNVPMVAVFDTAFHQTMPSKAYLYGIPYEYYEQYQIRKYGFHGTSHSFVSRRCIELLKKRKEDTKVIVCHLGNGSSICAVKGGESVDTSMGFTPLDGLVMGTRSGSVDPAVLEFLKEKLNCSTLEVMNILNKKSGVLGISGVSSDFRDLDIAAGEGNKRAKKALEVFSYRVAGFVGAYAAAMNGVDAIVFTAGIGENNSGVRKMVCDSLNYLGFSIDEEVNQIRGEEIEISKEDSKVKVYVIPTNEELMIARETVTMIL